MHICLGLLEVKQSTGPGSCTDFCDSLFKRKEEKPTNLNSFLNCLRSDAATCSVMNFVGIKFCGKRLCLEQHLVSHPCLPPHLFPGSPCNFMHCDHLANVLGILLGYDTQVPTTCPNQLLTMAAAQTLAQREMEKVGLRKLTAEPQEKTEGWRTLVTS